MIHITLLVSLTSISAITLQSDNNKMQLEAARELIELNGGGKQQMLLNLHNALPKLKQRYPTITDKGWDTFIQEFTREEFFQHGAKIYAKYFTYEEMTKTIRFLKTPAGRRLMEYGPKSSSLSKNDVDKIAIFYASPTGKKLLLEFPKLMKEVSEFTIKWQHDTVDRVKSKLYTN